MKLNLSLSILALGLTAALPLQALDNTGKELNPQLAFFNSLSSLCGQRFEGAMTFPTEGQDSFAGKLLVAKIESCTETEIRVPFAVGEDRSRTWIVSKTERGLQLKHDHRHEDGTPDEVNMYGGLATDKGSKLSQSFAADAHTAEVIPAASTNVWNLTLSSDGTSMTYHLTRHDAPRFTAKLFSTASRVTTPAASQEQDKELATKISK
jgi:hypothetical protein